MIVWQYDCWSSVQSHFAYAGVMLHAHTRPLTLRSEWTIHRPRDISALWSHDPTLLLLFTTRRTDRSCGNQPHIFQCCCYKSAYCIQPTLVLFLKVQRLRSNDVTPDLTQCRLEFLLEFLAAHDLGRLGDLAQQFLQTSEETDQAAFVDVCHFAASDC